MSDDDRLNRIQIDLKAKWPELRFTNSGKAIFTAKASLSTKAKDGDPQAKSGWVYQDFSLIAWEDEAEKLGNAVQDGDTLRITGRLGVESGWRKKSGEWTNPRPQITVYEAEVIGGGERTAPSPEKVAVDDIPF